MTKSPLSSGRRPPGRTQLAFSAFSSLVLPKENAFWPPRRGDEPVAKFVPDTQPVSQRTECTVSRAAEVHGVKGGWLGRAVRNPGRGALLQRDCRTRPGTATGAGRYRNVLCLKAASPCAVRSTQQASPQCSGLVLVCVEILAILISASDSLESATINQLSTRTVDGTRQHRGRPRLTPAQGNRSKARSVWLRALRA